MNATKTGWFIGHHFLGIHCQHDAVLLEIGKLMVGIYRKNGFLYRGWVPMIGWW